MVQCAISLLAAVPTALVHALDFFVTSSRTLVLLGTRDRDERINLRKVMLLKLAALQKFNGIIAGNIHRDFSVGKFPARQELIRGAYVYAYALDGTIGGA
jgi:hypothetical protein